MKSAVPHNSKPIQPKFTLEYGTSDLSIEEFLAQLPELPGVYLMRDGSERVLYVGKARDLSRRVRSYFRDPAGRTIKEAAMIGHVARVEVMVTGTESEALILEANLIKHHRPRYNVYLKDDKSYPYIRVTEEAYPRIRKTRRVIRDGSRYYGPFTSVKDMNVLLRAASQVFYARSCDEKLPFGPHRRECLDYHIGRCLAPCTARISAEDYRDMMGQAEALLSGDVESLAERLAQRMEECARKLDFERAAVLRDQIRGIKRVGARQRIVSDRDEDLDVIATAQRGTLVIAVVLEVRGGRLLGRRGHRLNAGEESQDNPQSVMEGFLSQYYLGDTAARGPSGSGQIPPCIILDPQVPATLGEALESARDRAIAIVNPKRGARRRLLDLAKTNAELLIDEHSLSRADPRVDDAIRDLAAQLEMTTRPVRIEAFDISHVQGTHVVAGMVVFVDGQPDRAEYRRFRIRGAHGNDDFASMREAVNRRYTRVRKEGLDPPDLVLIDGGKGQLSAAMEALENAQMPGLRTIGLAKRREEVFVPGRSDPWTMRPGSPGHLLLRRIRDEVHRYAVAYHRNLRSKASMESVLDAIPGIGKVRRRALLVRFPSIKAMENAGFEAVASVPGIGPSLAREVLLRLEQKDSQ